MNELKQQTEFNYLNELHQVNHLPTNTTPRAFMKELHYDLFTYHNQLKPLYQRLNQLMYREHQLDENFVILGFYQIAQNYNLQNDFPYSRLDCLLVSKYLSDKYFKHLQQ